jgi:hypothetical protein
MGCWLYPHEHDYGTIRCPADHPGEAHRVKVRGTSGDASGSDSARYIRRMLRKCRATSASVVAPVAGRDVEQLMLDAERLVTVAEDLQRSEALRGKSDVQLADAIALGQSEEAELLTAAADDSDVRAQRYEFASRQEAERFGLVSRWPPDRGSVELAEQARALLAEVRSTQSIPSQFAERIAQVESRLSRME